MASLMLWLPLVLLRPLLRGRTGYATDGLIVTLGLVMLQRQELAPMARPAWPWVPAYPLIACLVFALSVWLTAVRPSVYWRQLTFAMGSSSGREHRRLLGFALLTATYEELIWRCIFQPALAAGIGGPAAVVLTALAFALLHRRRTGGNLPQIVEIVCFSLLLGSLYALTGDPLLVILIHTIRNYLIHIGQLNRKQS